ncbi:MAG: hypothetical protein ACRENG_29395, partial [bacterium]
AWGEDDIVFPGRCPWANTFDPVGVAPQLLTKSLLILSCGLNLTLSSYSPPSRLTEILRRKNFYKQGKFSTWHHGENRTNISANIPTSLCGFRLHLHGVDSLTIVG